MRRRKYRLTDEQVQYVGTALLRMADECLNTADLTAALPLKRVMARQAARYVETYKTVIGGDGSSGYWDVTWKVRARQIAAILECVQCD